MHRRDGEVRDGAVIERGLGVDLLGQAAEAGAEDDPHARPAGPLGADRLHGLLDLVVQFRHEVGFQGGRAG